MKYKKIIAVLIVTICGFITKNQTKQPNSKKNPVQKQRSFNKNRGYTLTRHAKCRMDCRNIDDQDIRDILKNGKNNYKKSEPNKKPCPIKALEGYASKDKQHIRVIAATCPNKTKIITVIDLKRNYDCYCK